MSFFITNRVKFGGFAGVVPPVAFSIGATKLIPNNESYMITPITESNSTQHVKVEAEAAFTRVRLRFYCGASDAGTIKLALAPTEAVANDTDDNRYKPISGGSVDNTLWEQATFGGVSVGDISDGTSVDIGITVSDWVDVSSLTPVSGERPFLLARINLNATNLTVVSGGAMDLWRAASGETFYRLFDKGSAAGDNTESPNNTPTGAFSGGSHWFSFEFDYGVNTKTILAAGDSITAGGGGQVATFDQWTLRAANNMSTPTQPWNSYNIGMSGRNSAEYMTALMNELDSLKGDLLPKYVTIPAFTPNDGNPTQASADSRILKIIAACERCAELGITPIVWTGLPNDGYGVDTWRAYANDWAKDTSNQTTYGFEMLDFDALVGTGANPNRFKDGWTTDGIHPALVAIQAMALALSDKITELEG